MSLFGFFCFFFLSLVLVLFHFWLFLFVWLYFFFVLFSFFLEGGCHSFTKDVPVHVIMILFLAYDCFHKNHIIQFEYSYHV